MSYFIPSQPAAVVLFLLLILIFKSVLKENLITGITIERKRIAIATLLVVM